MAAIAIAITTMQLALNGAGYKSTEQLRQARQIKLAEIKARNRAADAAWDGLRCTWCGAPMTDDGYGLDGACSTECAEHIDGAVDRANERAYISREW